MKAIFSPGPAYSDPEVRKYAGWVHILELYRTALEELAFEIFIPNVANELIDTSSTVGKITSYDLVSASQLPKDVALFCGPPGYSLAQMLSLPRETKKLVWVWNNSDIHRDEVLAEEYKRFNAHYDTSRTWRWINERALLLADSVVACSPFVKKTHARVIPESKISIAFWGVDSQKYTPAKKEPEIFRILFVGGDPIRKGLIYLLQALEVLSGFELWIVGCAPLDDPVAQRLNARQFGMIPNDRMPDIYRQCSVLVCPTLEDGIALCVHEAMASGLPVITSPETAEVLEDGKSGFTVGYRDTAAIREKILLLRDNPELRRNMGKEARKLAESQTWDETKRQFKEIIRREMSG